MVENVKGHFLYPSILSINELLTKDSSDFSSPVTRKDATSLDIQAEDSISTTTPFLIDRNKISNQIGTREKVEKKQQQLNVLPRVKGIKHESVS